MTLEREFEDRLCELCLDAKDGRGLSVILMPSIIPPSANDLRSSLAEFLTGSSGQNQFLSLNGDVGESAAEAAYWDNVALLARATAAALRVEMKK